MARSYRTPPARVGQQTADVERDRGKRIKQARQTAKRVRRARKGHHRRW